jgi:hypothetical protein
MRRHSRKLLRLELIGTLRPELSRRWSEKYVPLSYRAAFWKAFARPSFVHNSLHREELDRLNLLPSARLSRDRKRLKEERDQLYWNMKKGKGSMDAAAVQSLIATASGLESKSHKKRKWRLAHEWVWPDDPVYHQSLERSNLSSELVVRMESLAGSLEDGEPTVTNASVQLLKSNLIGQNAAAVARILLYPPAGMLS